MATHSEEDLCCPSCQDIFVDPVILSCSHSFCKTCLHNWWKVKQCQTCPICRTVSIWGDPPRNLALKNLCEAFLLEKNRRASLRHTNVSTPGFCSQHSEKFKLFCVDHQMPVCVICRDSKQHANHAFKPIDEVAQDRREKLRGSLKGLQEKLVVFNDVKANFTQTEKHIKVQFRRTERQIQDQFEKLHKFLEDEEEARMTALREEEEQKSQMMKEKSEALGREIAALSDTVRATEDQLRTDDVSFILNYKSATEKVQNYNMQNEPELNTGALSTLIDVAKHLGNLSFNIWTEMKSMVSFSPVVLDPNTAHSELILSDDLISVKHGKKRQQLFIPENPERFEYWDAVLGLGLDSGTHIWVVEVGENKDWELGVSAENACRKGFVGSMVWSVEFTDGSYKVFSSIKKFTRQLQQPPIGKLRKIRVRLDWDKGHLEFSDPDTDTHIHTFTHTFTDKLCPYLCTRHSVPLKILPGKVCVTVES